MPTNDGTVDDPHRVGFNGAKDFITCLHGISLRPLRSMDKSSSEFSADLEGYLSVLDRGGSIASGRGHELASVRLGKLLETLFLTPTPSVREGPPLTWATVVLFAGPHFEGPSKLKIGESLVELPESDLGLLSSGRPWRFLYPWPDKDDCEKELRSIETALQELNNTRQTIHEGERPMASLLSMILQRLNWATAVLRKMLVVEQRLTNHHDVVAQLLQDEPQAALQRKTLEFGRDRANPPNEAASNVGTSDARVPREDAVSDSYQPPLPQEVHERCSNQSIQPTIEELRDKGEAGDSVSGNSMQHENPQPMTITGERSRLHLSDFIQTLSE
ncbi:hypothetical protein N7470_008938 [Penicillium chermesinum]|nr:hypothetical protein N7470_008938 [Penicillium chermesinum]